MALPEKKIGLVPALLVALLAFGGFVGVATVVSNNASQLTPVSLASKDDGDDNDDDNGDNEDEDKDDDKDKDKESESDKKAKEEAKKES